MNGNRQLRLFSRIGTESMNLLKPEEAASELGISKKTLHRLCRDGRIAYVEINDKVRRFSLTRFKNTLKGELYPLVLTALPLGVCRT